MKPLICLIFCSILCTSILAQGIQKGDKFFGLQTNLAYTDLYGTYLDLSFSNNQKRIGFHLAPTWQWAVDNNFVLGTAAHIGFNSEKYKNDFWVPGGEQKYEVFDIGANAFSRYYIDITRNKKLKFFGLAGFHLAYTSWEGSYRGFGSSNSDRELLLKGSFGFGAAYSSRRGIIDLNISNAGFFLGVHKKLKGKSGK